MVMYFIPFKCIGNFEIDTSIKSYLKEYDFEYFMDIDNIGRDTFSLDDIGISLYVESSNQIIESINCSESCLYRGRNIIGMTINEFIVHAETFYYEEPDCLDFDEDDIPQYVYEFEDIGLQVWTKHNRIVNVIASGLIAEDK